MFQSIIWPSIIFVISDFWPKGENEHGKRMRVILRSAQRLRKFDQFIFLLFTDGQIDGCTKIKLGRDIPAMHKICERSEPRIVEAPGAGPYASQHNYDWSHLYYSNIDF